MEHYKKHLLSDQSTVRDALVLINDLPNAATVFVVNDNQELLGSISDGDIRRALITGAEITDNILSVTHRNFKFIRKGETALDKLAEFRSKKIYLIPVLEKNSDCVTNILDLNRHRSYLPIDAIIMAGGKGQRLMPLTKNTPKPLLKVGDTPIIERNIDRMALYGIDDITISINYLGEQLVNHFNDGSQKGINIGYVEENEPLGTIGSASLIEDFHNDYVLIMNSDLLTNIDFESFFKDFMNEEADISIVSIPYQVDIPYAVLETEGRTITGLREKPRYTYYSNGGIYLMKKEVLDSIPKATFYNATDLVEHVIEKGGNVISFPLVDYWLDIGNHHDFEKAQSDVAHIKF